LARRTPLEVVTDKARAVNEAYTEVEKLAKRLSPEAKSLARELERRIKQTAKAKKSRKR